MAGDRLVGLLGPGQGPAVPMMGKPSRVRISGMDGGFAQATVDEHNQLLIDSNGEFDLPAGYFVQFSYEGESAGFQATLLRG